MTTPPSPYGEPYPPYYQPQGPHHAPPGWPQPQGSGLASAPMTVKVAFWLQLVAVGLLLAVSLLMLVVAIDELGNPFLSDDDRVLAVMLVVMAALGTLQAITLGIAARFLLQGSNVARIVSGIALVLALITNCLVFLLGVAVVILLFVGSSGPWFQRRTTPPRHPV